MVSQWTSSSGQRRLPHKITELRAARCGVTRENRTGSKDPNVTAPVDQTTLARQRDRLRDGDVGDAGNAGGAGGDDCI